MDSEEDLRWYQALKSGEASASDPVATEALRVRGAILARREAINRQIEASEEHGLQRLKFRMRSEGISDRSGVSNNGARSWASDIRLYKFATAASLFLLVTIIGQNQFKSEPEYSQFRGIGITGSENGQEVILLEVENLSEAVEKLVASSNKLGISYSLDVKPNQLSYVFSTSQTLGALQLLEEIGANKPDHDGRFTLILKQKKLGK